MNPPQNDQEMQAMDEMFNLEREALYQFLKHQIDGIGDYSGPSMSYGNDGSARHSAYVAPSVKIEIEPPTQFMQEDPEPEGERRGMRIRMPEQ